MRRRFPRPNSLRAAPIARALPVAFAAVLLPVAAAAHGGHGGALAGLSDGLVHPLTGIGHLALALAAGATVLRLHGLKAAAVPIAFLGSLAIGLLIAVPPTAVILAQSLAIGLAIALAALAAVSPGQLRRSGVRARTQRHAVPLLAAVAGLAQGAAHGPVLATADAGFSLGLLAGTAAVHLLAVALATVAKSRVPAFRRA